MTIRKYDCQLHACERKNVGKVDVLQCLFILLIIDSAICKHVDKAYQHEHR